MIMTMPTKLIVSPYGDPGQELKVAAAQFLQAFLNQYPRAAVAVKDGFVLSIANRGGPILQIAGALGGPPGELIWWRLGEVVNHCAECPIIAANSPYTQESIPTAPRAGATPCRASCKCYLTTSPPTTPPKSTVIDQNAAAATNTQFEDRVFLPPPVPPGLRLPTADERGVLRDLEIRRNEARRRAYAAAMDGDKELASVWRRQSRDLTGEIMTYAEDRQIHHVPTFRVSDVVTGKDIGRRDIDRLTHIRGLDGVTVSRAHAQAVLDAVNAAKRNLLADLETYPDVGGFTRESWRDAIKAAGATPSAFGGDLYRLGTEATCCGEADCGRCQSRLSPVVRADESECRCARGTHARRPAARPPAGAMLATEASTPTVQACKSAWKPASKWAPLPYGKRRKPARTNGPMPRYQIGTRPD